MMHGKGKFYFIATLSHFDFTVSIDLLDQCPYLTLFPGGSHHPDFVPIAAVLCSLMTNDVYHRRLMLQETVCWMQNGQAF